MTPPTRTFAQAQYGTGRGWHTGAQVYADPSNRLVVAVYWNGMADADIQARRLPALLDALYDDLGDARIAGE